MRSYKAANNTDHIIILLIFIFTGLHGYEITPDERESTERFKTRAANFRIMADQKTGGAAPDEFVSEYSVSVRADTKPKARRNA